MPNEPPIRPLQSMQIYRRAHERGEIDLGSVPEAVLAMPFDLVRHDLRMTLRPIPRDRVLAIVDDLFLPLVAKDSQPPSAAPGDRDEHASPHRGGARTSRRGAGLPEAG